MTIYVIECQTNTGRMFQASAEHKNDTRLGFYDYLALAEKFRLKNEVVINVILKHITQRRIP